MLFVMVVVVIALFAGVFWVTIPALRQAVEAQLSLQPFQEAQDRATRSLVDLGQIIRSDNEFLRSLRADLSPVKDRLDTCSTEELIKPPPELLKELDEIRNREFEPGNPSVKNFWDHATRVMLRAETYNPGEEGLLGFSSRADLLVVLDESGQVLFELNTQSNPQMPDQLGRLAVTIPLAKTHLPPPSALFLDTPLVNLALDNLERSDEPIVSYQKYPDGELYNMVALPSQDRHYLLLLGERVDMRTAFHAASPNTAVLVLVHGRYENGYRLPQHASSAAGQSRPLAEYGTLAPKVPLDLRDPNREGPGPWLLGPALVKVSEEKHLDWLPLSGKLGRYDEPGLHEVNLVGESFLALPHPLLDAPRLFEVQAPLPVGARPSSPTPSVSASPDQGTYEILGWLILLKPTEEITRSVRAQQLFILAVGLIAALLAAMLAGPLSRHVTGPILVLASKMRGVVERGDLSRTDPAGSLEIAEAGEAFNQMVAGLRQKDVLEKFVPEETRAEVAQEGRLVLGQAQRVTATVMFSDLRGFTSLSERLDPSELVEILGEYLRRMTAVVLENDGSIYEYIGDAILAVFRDRDGVSGAEQAVRAALAMHRELGAYQNASEHEEVRAMRQGIGLNTGLLVDGNIGMEARAKRAVIGDVVNLAARIQDRSRDGKHTDILVSETTYQLTRDKFAFEFFGREQFKGKSQPEAVWEVLDRPLDGQ